MQGNAAGRRAWLDKHEDVYPGDTIPLRQFGLRSLVSATEAHYHHPGSAQALTQIEIACAVLREYGTVPDRIQSSILAAMLRRCTGQLHAAKAQIVEALRLASDRHSQLCVARLLRELSIVSWRLGQLPSAAKAARLAVRYMPIDASKQDQALAQLCVTRCYIFELDADAAQRTLEKISVQNDDLAPRLLALHAEYEGLVELLRHDGSAALERFERSQQLLVTGGIRSYESTEIMLRKAEAYISLDRYSDAVRECTDALKQLNQTGERLERGHLYRQRGLAYFWMGRPHTALPDFESAERELRAVGDLYELGRLLCDRAEYITDNVERCLADASEAIALFESMELPAELRRARDLRRISDERIRRETQTEIARSDLRETLGGMIAESKLMQSLLTETMLVANHSGPVLISGETGTGKELIARLIHKKSNRANKPLVCVNCAALPESLIEREIFGHVKGAFTGADSDRSGYVDAAHGGTLFLDELGELPLPLQSKLLRLLQDGSYNRVGDVRERKADLRIIAASNRELRVQVDKKEFREDLYYRLACFRLELPPLRERGEDVVLIAHYFAEREARALELDLYFEQDFWTYLRRHRWPGNVRELEMAIKRACALSRPSGLVKVEHLPDEIRPAQANGSDRVGGSLNLRKILDDTERMVLLEGLRQTDYDRAKAASLLGIGRNTLYEKLKRYGISPEHPYGKGRAREPRTKNIANRIEGTNSKKKRGES
jgi:two-component system response regulator HydG